MKADSTTTYHTGWRIAAQSRFVNYYLRTITHRGNISPLSVAVKYTYYNFSSKMTRGIENISIAKNKINVNL